MTGTQPENEPEFEEPAPAVGAGPSRISEPDDQEIGSLIEDVKAIAADGKTYLDAELQFQKTRAGFAGANAGKAAGLGAGAALCALLALIGLTLGLLLGLAVEIGIWWATAIVVLAWLAGAIALAFAARSKIRTASSAFSKPPQTPSQGPN